MERGHATERLGAKTAPSGRRPLFLSGGSALRRCCTQLSSVSNRTLHLTTPFDSGGSSAELRNAFGIPAFGDLRNRLVSLSDPTRRGAERVERLFSYRFPSVSLGNHLSDELLELIRGEHDLLEGVPNDIASMARVHLDVFLRACPSALSLAGASLGNLILVGGYLAHERKMSAFLRQWHQLLCVRGQVALSSLEDRHLAVRLQSGRELYGQAAFTGKGHVPIDSAVVELFAIDHPERRNPTRVRASRRALSWMRLADAIVYPMGSFFSSVLCHLIPLGVATTIANRRCPKIWIPNLGRDPEQWGMSLCRGIEHMLTIARRDDAAIHAPDVVSHVLLDTARGSYSLSLDIEAVRKLGVCVVETPLAKCPDEVDPELFAQAIFSYCA